MENISQKKFIIKKLIIKKIKLWLKIILFLKYLLYNNFLFMPINNHLFRHDLYFQHIV